MTEDLKYMVKGLVAYFLYQDGFVCYPFKVRILGRTNSALHVQDIAFGEIYLVDLEEVDRKLFPTKKDAIKGGIEAMEHDLAQLTRSQERYPLQSLDHPKIVQERLTYLKEVSQPAEEITTCRYPEKAWYLNMDTLTIQQVTIQGHNGYSLTSKEVGEGVLHLGRLYRNFYHAHQALLEELRDLKYKRTTKLAQISKAIQQLRENLDSQIQMFDEEHAAMDTLDKTFEAFLANTKKEG